MGPIEDMAVPDITPDAMAKAIAEAKTVAAVQRGSDTAALVLLVEQIVARIDIGPEAVATVLDSHKIDGLLGFDSEIATSSLEITIPARLKRSGLAMRLILPGDELESMTNP